MNEAPDPARPWFRHVIWPRPLRRKGLGRVNVRGVAGYAAGALVGLVSLWFIAQAVGRLPWRVVTEVAVVGYRNVDPERILDQAQVTVGAPLFGVDADSVVQRVRALPWVRQASVRRRLSGRFEIHVKERVPVGMLWDRGFQLIDASGYAAPLETALPPDVPLVSGLPKPGEARDAMLRRAARVLTTAGGLAPLRSAISEVSLRDPRMLVLILSPRGTPVLLPPDPGRDRLVMLASVVAHHPDVLRQARCLDARFVGQVAVSPRVD